MPAGEAVIREGDTPDALYVLVDGAAVVTSGAGGRLNTMAAGDFFGEIGLLKGVPRTATVTSTEPCNAPADRRGDVSCRSSARASRTAASWAAASVPGSRCGVDPRQRSSRLRRPVSDRLRLR